LGLQLAFSSAEIVQTRAEQKPLFCSAIRCRRYFSAIATKHPQRSAVLWTGHAHHKYRHRSAVAASDNVPRIDIRHSSLIGHELTQQDPAD
jgi:hypothetical protein